MSVCRVGVGRGAGEGGRWEREEVKPWWWQQPRIVSSFPPRQGTGHYTPWQCGKQVGGAGVREEERY